MTFEEAIRALQRANTKARLKPTARPATPAAEPARADGKPAQSAEPPTDAPEPAAAAEPASSDAAPGPVQSAEDILAAARARIQQRSGVATAKPEPAAVQKAPPAPAPEMPSADAADSQPPVEPADTAALTDAIKAAMSAGTVRGVEPASPKATADVVARPLQPPAPPIAQKPPWTPPPEPRPPPAQRVPPPARQQPPFPARPVAASEGPRRPPLPPPGQAQVGFPNRPPRGAPWPETGGGARPPMANGSYAETPPAPRERPGARGQQAPRGGGHTEKGVLVEAVPRRMRVGVPAPAEVRIARDRIEGLIATLNGRGAAPLGEPPLTRALSVRLRAPGGDFWIEPATPETQWVDSASSMIHDDHANWRWTVVARRRGRGRLTLMVSARTVGRDGLAVESAPPDRVIEVKVGGNYRQVAMRWAGWILALLVGAAIGSYWEQIWAIAVPAITMALGG
jgi:hypothetical protein